MSDVEQDDKDQAETQPQADAPVDQQIAESPAGTAVAANEEAEGELSAEAVEHLEGIFEALLLAADQPLSVERLQRLVDDEYKLAKKDVRTVLAALSNSLQSRAVELHEVAGGFRLQVGAKHADWVARLWQERPPRLTRALLETLALIVYRQPITRGEIEDIRGVTTSPNIIRTLFERGWIREVGVREVPGRPTLLGTTGQFLDDFNLKALDELPSLPEIKDPEQLEAALKRLGADRDAVQIAGAVTSLEAEAQQRAAAEAAEAAEDAAQQAAAPQLATESDPDADSDPAADAAGGDDEDGADSHTDEQAGERPAPPSTS